MQKKTNEKIALKFKYGNYQLLLSKHAFDRIRERFDLHTRREVEWKVYQILNNGVECFNIIRDRNTGKAQKQKVISYEDTTLHIREDTIVTVKHNYQFYGRAIQKKGVRSLNHNYR